MTADWWLGFLTGALAGAALLAGGLVAAVWWLLDEPEPQPPPRPGTPSSRALWRWLRGRQREGAGLAASGLHGRGR